MRGNDFMELRAFELVARHQSFSRAADHLGVSRAAISGVVKNLEKRLGVQLLTRTTRSVSLTDAGRELLDRLSPALNELVSAVAHIDQFREKPKGRIRLLTCHLAMELYLPTLVPAFAKAQPEVTLDIHVEEGDIDLVAKGCDAAILPVGHINQDFIALELGTTCRQIIVASNDYLKRHSSPGTVEDLRHHTCVKVVSPATGNGNWDLISGEGVARVSVAESMSVNNFSLALQAVVGGMGMALVPQIFAESALKMGDIQQVLPAYWADIKPFCLCYPRHHCSTLAFRSFIEFCRDFRAAKDAFASFEGNSAH